MKTSVMGLPATYTVERAIIDFRLATSFIVRCDHRFIGFAESMRDAQFAARLHSSLFGGSVLN